MRLRGNYKDASHEELITELEKRDAEQAKTFSRPTKSPKIILHEGEWCLIIPGRKEYVPIGRQGSLKGELLAVVGANWGSVYGIEYVLDELARRVTDRRTVAPDQQNISTALKEINRTLGEANVRRVRRIGTAADTIGFAWKHMLWMAALVDTSEGVMVGFLSAKKPPTRIKTR